MPFYGADFIGNTLHLSRGEIGSYVLLLWHHWEHGSLPADETELRRIARVEAGPHWPKVWARLGPLFQPDRCSPGRIVQPRLCRELVRTAEISNKRKAAAEQMHSKRHANAEQVHTQSQSQSQSQSNKEYAFESGIIRLTEKDFNQWKSAFSHLDLAAELLGLSKWASEQGLNWFPALSGALAKRNREAKARLTEKPKFKTLSGMEGIL